MDILNDIIDGLNKKFNGKLVCEEQRADLFVYVNGLEATITAVDTEMIYFEDDALNVRLVDTDIQHLSYLNEIIN
jgi:hypothetical protein|tara:strand:+ start:1031 stop:1255 length:225 start_codon:yes stop_codon:yes gene_type:complete